MQLRYLAVAATVFLSLLSGCGTSTQSAALAPTAAAPPPTEAAAAVEVVGIYEQFNVAKRGPEKYVGRVEIRQKDGGTVMLETHDLGVRSADEIATFEGKQVKVTAASASDYCHAWGDGTRAAIVGPCIRGIVDIALAAP